MRAERLTHALGGRWHGSYGTARCPAHDDRNPSLSIRNGEAGTLLLHCFAGCAYHDIRSAAEAKLSVRLGRGHEGGIAKPIPKSAAAANSDLAARIWSQALPISGTPAEQYLRTRSITGDLPETLRFHPALRHPDGVFLPAMVARVENVSAPTCAIHRTYLDSEASRKTNRQPAKAMLGPCRGGAVHLRDGRARLIVCEGIETGLSLRDAVDESDSVWSALSASGVSALRLPNPKRHGCLLLIACDGDAPGRLAGRTLGERAAKLGWAVELLSAPDHLDFNDLARAGGRDA